MAERVAPALAGRLCTALDGACDRWFLALDEGATPEEATPAALIDRLAFHIDLSDARLDDVVEIGSEGALPLEAVGVPNDMIETVAGLTVALGIGSARAAQFTLRAARGVAALRGGTCVEPTDLETAATLVLAHRATQQPQAESEPPEESQTPPESDGSDSGEESLDGLPQEMLLDAIAALIPVDLLGPTCGTSCPVGAG